MDELIIEYAGGDELVALRDGHRVGCLRWQVAGADAVELTLRHADDSDGATLMAAAEEVIAEQGFRWLLDDGVRRRLPVALEVPSASAMQTLGVRLANLVEPGDLLMLSGDLGAGKTTLTQGIGAGLGVDGPITSPTFVLSRIHPAGPGKPDLVHVDAYRLDSLDEVDDIDLDSDVNHSVTVVEWGAGVAEQLSADRLEIEIRRAPGGDAALADTRTVIVRPVGQRWAGLQLEPEGNQA